MIVPHLSETENHPEPQTFFCSDPTILGGLYVQMVFSSVQSILTDRYIHRSELQAVLLANPSNAESNFKKKLTTFRCFWKQRNTDVSSFVDICLIPDVLPTFFVIIVQLF